MNLRTNLSHVFWIGGATNAGKSTAARLLSERHGVQVYHYDQRDAAHVELLAETHPEYRAFLAASLDERWGIPEPEELFRFVVRGFHARFPLMIEDILTLPPDTGIVAEGFGLLPELVIPLLTRPNQAVWLVPTDEFKDASMERRGKPSFKLEVSDPERVKSNLRKRDQLLAAFIHEQVTAFGGTLFEVDGSRTPEEMADIVEAFFLL